MKKIPSLLMHCQYVYGIGHFVRSIEIARALKNEFNVCLVIGGEQILNYPIPDGITIAHLPAIYKNETTGNLIPVDSSLSLEICFEQRGKQLEQLVQAWQPDIVITEHFPFGLLFEKEVLQMLKLARDINPNTMIVSSIRDVIDSASGGNHDAHICSLLNKWFDLILVHGDPRFITLNESFPLLEQITTPHVYTGYVVSKPEPRCKRNGPPLLLGSIGGGRIGQELLSALRAAHRHLVHDWEHELILFKGAFDIETVEEDEPCSSLYIQNFDRIAYRKALAQADGVICLGGYNSISESLSMQLPTLVYKRKSIGSNHEQALRAELFKLSGLIKTIEEEDLETQQLGKLMSAFFREHVTTPPNIDFLGAENTCRIMLSSWQTHQQQVGI